MLIDISRTRLGYFFAVSTLFAVIAIGDAAWAQVKLPEVVVSGAKPKPKQTPRAAQHVRAAQGRPAPAAPVDAATAKSNAFDQSRSNIYTTVGTTSATIGHDTIQAMPQGTNAPVEKVLLQAPGVSQDSAASGLLHVRNDHANVQFRINGVLLPDGVTGFSSVLDTDLIGKISLVTGALPAEYGLRTVGLVDITTRTDIFNNSGSVSLYGGSRGTFAPSFEYGGTFGNTCPGPTPIVTKSTADCFAGVQYFFTGRYLQTTEGIENPIATLNAIHDFSQQEKGFAYMSTFIDPSTRLSLIAGTSINSFQIPNSPGQPVGLNGNVMSAFGITTFDSSNLNENQKETTHYGVLALQKSVNGFDGQLSYFTRYNNLHFLPDQLGDLLINGAATDITRRSYTNGIQGDGAYAINPAHTLRGGFTVSAEQAFVGNSSLVEACIAACGTLTQVAAEPPPPFTLTDNVSKLGWLIGGYIQDEWRVTSQFTVNAGLRFDQMYQFVNANQFSPRLSITYKPFQFTTFHAGYARYFTPPVLVEAAPVNLAEFSTTTAAAPPGQRGDPVLPERSHYFDVGVVQNIPFGCSTPAARTCTDLDLGVDAYYKIAKDLIDNGVFGQALVLSAFNYAKGINEGIEFSANFHSGSFQAYGNLALARQKATDVVSNQYLFDNSTPLADLGGLTRFQYVQSHWIYTDHAQIATASAGALYQVCGRPANVAETFGGLMASSWPWGSWCGVKLSANMIFGSGLRRGDANIDHEPPYAQFNAGIAREFLLPDDPKPMTVRFDVINVFDTIYQLRSGTGIGVFAPQYGPRIGYFLGASKKF